MQAELEPSEHSALEGSLRTLASEHDDLCAALRKEMTRVAGAVDVRRRLEADLEQALAWIKTKANEIKPGGWTPLKATAIEKEIQHYKVRDLHN